MKNGLQSRSIKTSSRGNIFHGIYKVYQLSTQKYLGIHLDEELTFKHHLNEKIKPIRVLELFVN